MNTGMDTARGGGAWGRQQEEPRADEHANTAKTANTAEGKTVEGKIKAPKTNKGVNTISHTTTQETTTRLNMTAAVDPTPPTQPTGANQARARGKYPRPNTAVDAALLHQPPAAQEADGDLAQSRADTAPKTIMGMHNTDDPDTITTISDKTTEETTTSLNATTVVDRTPRTQPTSADQARARAGTAPVVLGPPLRYPEPKTTEANQSR